ncbi:hypothetical protein ANSO36C_55590 [Nostoc cf. commune SO-36]|uniref:Bacteriocin n=1 Tax=Nostoc cf. commune SO-36 TaxID=449208 RepID=A0ABN6QCT2_NOSCO|nr:hypothetical protein [Nostoc commune]BDI19757.1 hypothetical protein ANSO36C_55590 [Nostoc cf. commune SO-36]
MENIEEKNLPISEQQSEASDELNTEELEAVAGGGNPIVEGVRDAAQGLSDGLSGENSGESNLNYLGGNIVGKAVDTVGGLISGK